MSKNEIVSLIETMNNYDELANKAKAKADAIRDALKEEMLRLDTEELNAGAYILRYDTGKGALRNGKCQSQGREDWQAAFDPRRYSCILSAALSGV